MDSLSKKYSASTWTKFIILSLVGIFVFFVDIPLPGYTIVGAVVAPRSTIIVNHFSSFVTSLLWNGNIKAMSYIVLAFCLYGLLDLVFRRKKHFSTPVGKVFSVVKVIGVVFAVFAVFKIGPGVLHQPRDLLGGSNISAFALNRVVIPISISIPLAMIFLPLLLDFGLMEFIGVFVRPIMRPVYRLPGRSAVILISAFLGNFSVGHIACDKDYQSGHMTKREASIISYGFCTVSVAFLMVLFNNANFWPVQGETHPNPIGWNLFFWTSFAIVLIVTFINARIPPVSRIEDEFAPDVTPNPENIYKRNLLKNSMIEALDIAEKSDNLFVAVGKIMKTTGAVLASIIMGAGFSTSVGLLLYFHTPIFEWIGVIFRPLMMLVQIPAAEVNTAASGAAFSLLEVTIPSLLITTGDWSIHIRYMLIVIPVTSIIFLGSFVPSLISTNLPVKFWHMMVIWLERMILSVIITGIFALLIFGIPG